MHDTQTDRPSRKASGADTSVPSPMQAGLKHEPDPEVGQPGSAKRGGDAQTPEQATITGIGEGGRSDTDRQAAWHSFGSEPGSAPAPVGGSSAGQSDRRQSADRDGKVAQGHDTIEKEHR